MDAKQQEELIEFLRDNLKVEISCECGGCGEPTVQVTVSLGGKQISFSRDYLPSPLAFDRGGDWPGYWPGY